MPTIRKKVTREEATDKFVGILQTFHLYGSFGWNDSQFGDALAQVFPDYRPEPGAESRKVQAFQRMMSGRGSASMVGVSHTATQREPLDDDDD